MKNFEVLYKEHYAAMLSVANRMVNDPDTAYDIVQEVFIYLLERLKGGREIRHHKSWLTRATINKCVDHTYRLKRLRRIDSVKETFVTEDKIDRRESRLLVRSSLEKLAPKERALLILYSEGYSYKEMAAATGIRFTSIGKKLSRAILKMKDELKKRNYEMH